VFKNPDSLNDEVSQAMQPPLAAADAADTLDRVFSDLSGGSAAVVVARGGKPAGMLTRSDLLEYLARARNGS
jgi:predicted transcriptional regulator